MNPGQSETKESWERSFQKFGDRILRGGDLYEKEESWFAMVDNRPEDYVSQWPENVNCSVIRVDGAPPVEEYVGQLIQSITASQPGRAGRDFQVESVLVICQGGYL